MGSRTNMYKNPSYAYNKQLNINSALQNLQAYNVATGNVPSSSTEEPLVWEEEREKCKQRKRRRSVNVKNEVVVESDGPMSHHNYIEKRRREVCSHQGFEELSANVLETSRAGMHLVEYDSDGSTQGEAKQEPRVSGLIMEVYEEKQDPHHYGSISNGSWIKNRSEQRFPIPGEPVCVVCGKYGEYICDETDDDICSIDCKAELLEGMKSHQGSSSNQTLVESSSRSELPLQISESGGDIWDYNRHCWSRKSSSLCTYECWKCQQPGHLAEDCLVMMSKPRSLSSNENSDQVTFSPKVSNFISRGLQELYRRCRQFGSESSNVNCNACHRTSTLAACLYCSIILCDGAGHLSEHIRTHPSHRQYYSYKLNRLVKCCKSTCKVTDIEDLLACHYCFDKAFDKYYDMYTATWKGAGISIIAGSVCCEDHFEWHRMNCVNAGVEESAYIVKKGMKNVQLSDFIF